MRIHSVDHLVLTVTDLEASVAFYEQLGMRREMFGEGRIALQFGAQKLNLHPAGAEIAPHARRPTPGSADVCLLVAGSLEDCRRRTCRDRHSDRARAGRAHRRSGTDPLGLRP
jgi:catechol 2,3-dioxygenase-like lactoylglutathione lyase family enzyme